MTAAARFNAASAERAPPASSLSRSRLPSATRSRERRAVSFVAWRSRATRTKTTLSARGRAPKIRTSATSRVRNVAKKRRGNRTEPGRIGAPAKRKGTTTRRAGYAARGEKRGEKARGHAAGAGRDRRAGKEKRNDDERGALPRREGGARH